MAARGACHVLSGHVLSEAELLAFHRRLVATRSVSGEEAAIVDGLVAWLAERGLACERLGHSLFASVGPALGQAPLVVLNSHVDTVPAAPGWTVDPWAATTVEDAAGLKVVGLGANDAKASVAAMCAAFVAAAADPPPFTLALALAEGEETKGIGSERLVAHLRERGLVPAAVVVGEPTALEIAVAQKGLLVLELVAQGDAAHAAHARRLGARNAVRALARDLVRLEQVDLGPHHPQLGQATCEPTVLQGGTARNVVPAEASVILDVRTVPGETTEELVARLRQGLEGELLVRSDRLKCCGTDPAAPIVRAAQAARPAAQLYGSPTLSDWVFFREYPTIKVGPGHSDRSHRPDEFVYLHELCAGVNFYQRLLAALAQELGGA